ncbi:cytochrome p450 [Nannochloropsis oceanica]
MFFPEAVQALSAGAWVALLVTTLVLWMSWRFNLQGSFQAYVYDKRGTRLPGPINKWPFGFVWTVREWRRQNIWWIKSKEIFDIHGHTIGFRVFSSYSILTADPDCVRAIVTGSADLFPKGHLYKHLGLLPGGLFTTNGPRWRRDRRLLNPHFSFSAVATYVPSFNAHVDEFLGGLKGRCVGEGGKENGVAARGEISGRKEEEREEGVVVDMVQGFNRLTLDIIFDAGFGHDLHAVRQVRYRPARASDTGLVPPSSPSPSCSPSSREGGDDGSRGMDRLLDNARDEGDVIAEALRIAFTEVAKRLTDPLPFFKYFPRRYSQAKDATRVLRGVIDKAIAERRKRAEDREAGREGGMEETRGNLLDLMMAVHEEGTWYTQELLAHSMTMLVAGHETTSAMLTWTLMELGERPDLVQRLRAEIDEVCGSFQPASTSYSSAIDATHVERMPFLRSVLKESLRMHPPVTMFSRRTLKDLHLGGYLIPKGWHVGVSVYTLHRSPALWERPDEFWPDRWAEGQQGHAKGGEEGGKERVRAVSLDGGGAGVSPPRTPVSVHRAAAVANAEGGAPATFLSSPKPASSSTPTTGSSSGARSSSSSSHSRRASTSSIPMPLPKGPLKSPFQYVPFSLGPRNCIGQRFGTMEASIILARLLREWDVTLLDRAATVQRLELLTVRPDRLLCKLTPRKVSPGATPSGAAAFSSFFAVGAGMTCGGDRNIAQACIP